MNKNPGANLRGRGAWGEGHPKQGGQSYLHSHATENIRDVNQPATHVRGSAEIRGNP